MNEYLFTGDLSDFPVDDRLPEGVKELKFEDTFGLQCQCFPQVEYVRRGDFPLHLDIIVPVEGAPDEPQKDYPLVVYVQGSAWQEQQIYQNLGDMVRMAEHGWAVALVEYRPSPVAPIPAQAQDVKTAIRFLRKHGKEYRLLTEKIALWGDSSGGHTALLAGITGDSGPDTPEYGEYSAGVSCIVDYFGPTDLVEVCFDPCTIPHADADGFFGQAIGGYSALEHPDKAAPANIMNYLSADKPTPPILIMHGDRDHIVPFRQSCLLYEKLRELGKDVEMYKLLGGYHTYGGFHCDAVLEIVRAFLEKHY